MSAPGASERCSSCGVELDPDDGYRLGERPGARHAAFCRLEHVVPWAIRGAHWEAGELDLGIPEAEAPTTCASCGKALGDVRLTLVRHRGPHRVPDGFCSVEHLAGWARAGGRYAPG